MVIGLILSVMVVGTGMFSFQAPCHMSQLITDQLPWYAA
jgi:hypothetical protein